MGASLRIGKIFGIPVEVNASWVVIFLLLTYVLAQQFDDSGLAWSAVQRWLMAALMVGLFFLSVLVHELSHSALALRRGIPVRGITLFIFGGVSRLARQPGRPMTEFSVAVVGPLTSLALAGMTAAPWYFLDLGDSAVGVALFLLAWSNLWLGAFNLLPGFPLDGGRVLRAAIWARTGSYRKATLIATRTGQVIAALIMAAGLGIAIFVDLFNGIWIAVVGGFLLSLATAGYREESSAPPAPVDRVWNSQDA